MRIFSFKPLLFVPILLTLGLASSTKAQTYDLASDWSDTSNPNGVWSYGILSANATSFTPFALHPSDYVNVGPPAFTGSQPAWTRTANTGNNGSPEGLAKSTGIAASGMDFPTGAVGGHTPASSQYLATRWTAPQAGNVDISGSLWLWQNFGRTEEASLFVKGSSLFSGIIIPQPPTNTSSIPYTFNSAIVAGGGNTNSLLSIPVQAGDTIILAVRRRDVEWFVGMNETIRLTPSAAPEAGSLALIATCILPVIFHSRYRK